MSTRYWRKWFSGNPQRRCYLPNLHLILTRFPDTPPEILCFKGPVQMTNNLTKSYLEKIYNVPVASVRSAITCGKTDLSPMRKDLIKVEDDYRRIWVRLKEGYYFNFPNLFPEIKTKALEDEAENLEEQRKKQVEERKKLLRGELPKWFQE